MPPSQIKSSGALARPVIGILWLGLAAAGALVLAQTAITPHLGLSLAVGILTLFVAAIVATFSLRYMRADKHSNRYFVTLGAMVVAVLAFFIHG